MANLIGKAKKKKLVSGFLKYFNFNFIFILKYKFFVWQLSRNWNSSCYHVIMHRFYNCFVVIYLICCSHLRNLQLILTTKMPIILLLFFSIVWYFDDCLRRERYSKALGSST